jgi:CHASE3 domain sensor protein
MWCSRAFRGVETLFVRFHVLCFIDSAVVLQNGRDYSDNHDQMCIRSKRRIPVIEALIATYMDT